SLSDLKMRCFNGNSDPRFAEASQPFLASCDIISDKAHSGSIVAMKDPCFPGAEQFQPPSGNCFDISQSKASRTRSSSAYLILARARTMFPVAQMCGSNFS